MNDELETRLRESFRGQLPAAPASLAAALDEVTAAPVTRGSMRVRGRGLVGRRFGGLLAVAAVLLVGGAVAFSVGGRNPSPVPLTSASPSPVPSLPAEASPTFPPRLTFEPQWTASVPFDGRSLVGIVLRMQQRINEAGLVGVEVRTYDGERIVVDLSPGTDPDPVRRLVGTTGVLGFVPLGAVTVDVGDYLDPASFPPLFDGSHVVSASLAGDRPDQPTLLLTLREQATRLFADYTATHIGEYFAIVLDGIVVTAPVIQSEIPDGEVEITFGRENRVDLVRLATIISSGPLAVALVEVSGEPSPSATASVAASPSSPSGPPMALNLAPANLGCDLMRPPYDSLVIHIDPSEADPVWAIANTGARLQTFWSAGFRGEAGDEPVVLDAQGVIVARDGTRIDLPEADWPTLGGYFVCPSTDAIYVLSTPPS